MSEVAIRAKFLTLVRDVPKEFEPLAKVDLDSLATEVRKLPKKERLLLSRLGSLMTQLEALKMIASYDAHKSEMPALRDGLFFQDLMPLVVYHEFWKDLDIGRAPELGKIAQVLKGNRFNKIRNAIAHADFGIQGKRLHFNDRGYVVQVDAVQVSLLASCLACLASLLGIWAS